MKKYNFLIIGQGLAGSCLAERLIEAGRSVIVVDNGHKTASSMVAAGMWNPIVFKRLNKSWKADQLLPELEQFYTSLEKKLNKRFFHHLPIDRIFPNEEAYNLWQEKSDLPGFNQYLDDSPVDALPQEIEAVHGGGRVNGGGYVDLEVMLTSYRDYLKSENSLLEEEFDEVVLEVSAKGIEYKGIQFDYAVFCTGFKSIHSSWFGNLPMRTTKGEVLTVKSDELNYNSVMNVGRFMLPVGKGLFRIGATYEWHTENTETTAEGRNLLLEKTSRLLYKPYEVINQRAGIRPTVKDRRPLVGRHPKSPNVCIFNGLGTKGVMIAPWLSRHFVEHLLEGNALSDEVNITRFL